MKVRDFIKKLEGFDQEADIFFLEEYEDGANECFYFAVNENQVHRGNKLIERYYTIEKRE